MLDIQSLLGPSTLMRENGKPDGIGMITPKNVVKDMIDLLPDDIWNKDTKFLDIACKSGNFLIELYNRLINHPKLIEQLGDNIEYRREWILNNQLYGIALSEFDKAIATRNLYGYNTENSNIVYIKDYISTISSTDKNSIKLITDKIEGTFKDMKFDVVVGNPPYNNDIYLDFVKLGHKLADKYECMITPAKWQGKGGTKNEQFRKDIVPYMSKIIHYPVSTDIFNIGESAGISYYIIDKDKHYLKELKILCDGQKVISTNNEYILSDAKLLVNKDIRIIIDKCTNMKNELGNKLNLHQSYYVKNTDSGHVKTEDSDIEVWGGKAGGEKDVTGKQFFLLGYKCKRELLRTNNIDKYKACLSCMPTGNNKYGAFDETGMALGLKEVLMLEPNQIPKGSYFPLMCFNTKEEVLSFISYFNTRLIRFLIICSIVGTTISYELFRLVPDPVNYDHIFTDAELYRKYNLTEEEINIIESVIKERK